jgi:hypothetical protein
MVARMGKPADVPDAAWAALQAVVTAAAEQRRVDDTSLRLAARYFPSLRRMAA